MSNDREIYLILDNIRSRENVGSIFRTADAAGVAKIYLCGITPVPSSSGGATGQTPLRPWREDKISKTALGAEKYVPHEYIRNTWRLVTRLKVEGVFIAGIEQDRRAVDLFSFRTPDKPIALVLGNEVRGLSPKILKYCDRIIEIPMFGSKESLNVSVAAGIALYQIKHARNF